jgi:hypothetical protein
MVWANRNLVAETKRLADASRDELFDAHRPVIFPSGKLPLTYRYQLDWDRHTYEVTLQNAGAGVALTICGVLFPPKPSQPSSTLPRRYTLWREAPLLPAAPGRAIQMEMGRTIVNGDVTIDTYTLYAPERPTHQDSMSNCYNVVARLTLTYQDIFRRKHASVFDYIDLYGWQCVALLTDVSKDLEELDDEARAPFRAGGRR